MDGGETVRLAISATGPALDSEIDPRFGRCRYFVIVDPDRMEVEAVENSGGSSGGGAGVATAQTLAGKDISAVLTGNCGPNAYQVLAAGGIKVVAGASGKVRDAVVDFQSGKLKAVSQPSVAAHAGMSRGMGRGRDTRWR
jgi:predicted Fe-Mo cluster-binding NifX family protein